MIAAFVVTRLLLFHWAVHPGTYGPSNSGAGDVGVYQGWAQALVNEQRAPYSDVSIEYPPGSLPFIAIPEWLRIDPHPYSTFFVALMLFVDVAGFVAVSRLASRWRSSLGPWVWVSCVFLLGPVAVTRLDMVPAVMLLWSIERAAAGSGFSSATWLGLGSITKLFPALLAPLAFFSVDRRKAWIAGFALAAVVPLAPYLGSARAIYDSVVSYHADRGIQIESTWGSALGVIAERGGDAAIGYSFGAYHYAGELADSMKQASTVLSLIVLVGGTFLLIRATTRGDPKDLAAASFALLAALVVTGSVLSPQFMLWLIALGAATLSDPDSPVREAALTLVPVALLTQLIYPFMYQDVLDLEVQGLFVLAFRNVLLIAIAATSFAAILSRRRGPTTEEGAAQNA